MNRPIMIVTLFAMLVLAACDQQPTVVNAPAGPAGPAGAKGATGAEGVQGETGAQGDAGKKGEAGKTGDSTTVIVTPPAEPAN